MGSCDTVVLVHGAWHGAWCWAPVLARLDERGVPAVAVDLPGHGASTLPLGDLHGDADHVRSVLDGIDGPVVLVGHSYGGAVVTDAGTHPSVRRLVLVAAIAPDEDETVLDVLGRARDDDLEKVARPRGDGTTVVDPDLAGRAFYGDCTPDDVERAVSMLGAQPNASGLQRPRAVAWRDKPTTYVVCGADRAIAPGLQREVAGRIPDAAIVEWPDASHSPFLSRPAAVAELLAGLASQAQAAP